MPKHTSPTVSVWFGKRWMRTDCMQSLDMAQTGPTPLFMDNESSIAVAFSSASMRRSLYLVRRIYFLQEQVEMGEILPIPCTGDCNLADFLTKLGFSKQYVRRWLEAVYRHFGTNP